MKVRIEATLSELMQLWGAERACSLARVDYYKVCMVPSDEQFNVTEEDLARVGIIEQTHTGESS